MKAKMGQSSGLVILLQVVMLIGVSTILQVQSQSLGVLAASRGSVKAELLHREHVDSPLRSTQGLSHRETVLREVQRSMKRARTLTQRSLVEQQEVSFQSNVTDASPAEYLMSVSLGTPPQNFVVIADTGSDLPWLQCAPCKNCFNQSDAVFKPDKSATYEPLSCISAGCASLILDTFKYDYGVQSCHKGCQFDYRYGDQSNTSGVFSSDNINLMGTDGEQFSVPGFWFGCSHSSQTESGAYDNADGLFGLGQGLTSLPTQLGKTGLEDRFSYCLVNRTVAEVQSSRFVFGHDALLDSNSGKLQYTPIISNPAIPTFYYVSLEGITVNGAAADFNASAIAIDGSGSGGTIFDSGTPYTSLAPAAFDALVSAVILAVPENVERLSLNDTVFNLCYKVSTSADVSILPQISFKFGNSSVWDLTFENSWVIANFLDDENVELCLAMTSGSDPRGVSIIGSTQQQDFHVLYDREEKRIGFVPTDCAAVGI